MNNEFFNYLIINQLLWADMYKQQKYEHHKIIRLDYMKIYNKTYNIINREALKQRHKEKRLLKKKYDLQNNY